MKRLILAFAALAAVAAKADDTAFFTNVTNLWYQGHKSNVLAIAEERLAHNTNDIAGLILKMEYDLEFTRSDSISNSVLRIIEAGAEIKSLRFKIRYPELKIDLEDLLDVIASHPILDLEEERAKSLIPCKTMLTEPDLLLVCLDGLVTNYPALNP